VSVALAGARTTHDWELHRSFDSVSVPGAERVELENLRLLAGYRREWLFDPGLVDEVRVQYWMA
jgi:hypothetical protein